MDGANTQEPQTTNEDKTKEMEDETDLDRMIRKNVIEPPGASLERAVATACAPSAYGAGAVPNSLPAGEVPTAARAARQVKAFCREFPNLQAPPPPPKARCSEAASSSSDGRQFQDAPWRASASANAAPAEASKEDNFNGPYPWDYMDFNEKGELVPQENHDAWHSSGWNDDWWEKDENDAWPGWSDGSWRDREDRRQDGSSWWNEESDWWGEEEESAGPEVPVRQDAPYRPSVRPYPWQDPSTNYWQKSNRDNWREHHGYKRSRGGKHREWYAQKYDRHR